jgi:hypothetical protein
MADIKKLTTNTGAPVATGDNIPVVGQASRPSGHCFFGNALIKSTVSSIPQI